MTIRSLSIAGTAVALGAGLLLAPTTAQAATSHAPQPTASASSSSAADGIVAGSTQTRVESSSMSAVLVELELTRAADVVMTDEHGGYIGEKSGRPGKPVRFVVKPNGADLATYTVTPYPGGSPSTVTLDFRGMRLSSPVEQSTERDLLRMQRAVRGGATLQELPYEALPGATVTVTANGETHSAVADARGRAVVPVRFVVGTTTVTEEQRLGAKQSIVATSSYTL